MKIIRARISGFCMGVRRAVNMAREAAASGNNVYTFGPLIHNSRVLKNLEQLNIKILDNEVIPIAAGKSGKPVVIIRAHGIPPENEKNLAQSGAAILDATCPHVKVSQEKAGQFAGKGYSIFLAGEKDHGEIVGILGYARAAAPYGTNASCFIVGNSGEAEAAASGLRDSRPNAKTVLIGQTTISPEEYRSIGEVIRNYFPDLEVLDTICSSTAERQNALRELGEKTDAIIIAGSRESANTRRLLSLAKDLGKPCWLVDSPEEIPPEASNYRTIGITAGASAPDDLIDEIEKKLLLAGQ